MSFQTAITRREIRARLLQRRRALISREQKDLSLAIAKKICAAKLFRENQNIACYLAAKGEVDLRMVIEQIWARHKNCYLPVMDKEEKRQLHFISYGVNDDLVTGKHGIFEPHYVKQRSIAPQQLEVIFMPLVGFDMYGNRLGQGGGYYDYTLAFKRTCDLLAKPYLIGVAYGWQQVADIPVAAHDVKLAAVVTEEKWINFCLPDDAF